MNFTEIENAGFYSWPAFEQFENQGWVFRFANGYTKRANSVNILALDKDDNLEVKVDQCEEEYNRRNLPCIFRLLSVNDNTELEPILDARGYHKGDHSLVLAQDLKNRDFTAASFDDIGVEGWMAYYCDLNKKELKDHDTHIKMIQQIGDKKLLSVLFKNAKAVSCGLGVVHNGYFGIFDIVTHEYYRNKGYAAEMISGMSSWAVNKGSHTAYVQVVAENLPAIALYMKLGYGSCYEYHYKIQNWNLENV